MITANNLSVDFIHKNGDYYSIKKRLLKRLSRTREESTQRLALNNLNFNLHQGDRVAVFGRNGSGKSTLLRVIAQIFEPTSGELVVEGSVSSLIDSSFGLELDATGYENIYYRLLLTGWNDQKIKDCINEIIEFSELNDYIHQPIRSYSSGMQMRLSFAIATSVQSDVLIIDEWLSVGDAKFNEKAQSRMNQIISNSKVMILASHSKELLKKMCNRFFKMDNGVLTEISYEEFEKCDF